MKNRNTQIVTYNSSNSENLDSSENNRMPFRTPLIRRKDKNQIRRFSDNSENDRNLFNRFTFFLHFLFNFFIILSFLFIILSFFYIIKEEFRVKVIQEKERLKIKREESSYLYKINRCELEIPYMKLKCLEWKKDSEDEEIQIGRLFVESIGEMVDAFVQKVSWKMFVFLGLLGGMYIFINRNI